MISQRRSPWPFVIIAWFAVFIAFLAAFIIFAVRQREDLVRHDYYEAEVRYQQQLDRANRGQAFSRDVAITYEPAGQRVSIQLPPAQARLHPTGRIHFYRPSDASLDHATPLVTDANGVQYVNAAHLRPGLWKVHLYWTVNDQEFFFDQAIVVVPKQSAGASNGTTSSSSLTLSWLSSTSAKFRVPASRFLSSAFRTVSWKSESERWMFAAFLA